MLDRAGHGTLVTGPDMLGCVDLDREQLRGIARILIPGIAAAALLLPALA